MTVILLLLTLSNPLIDARLQEQKAASRYYVVFDRGLDHNRKLNIVWQIHVASGYSDQTLIIYKAYKRQVDLYWKDVIGHRLILWNHRTAIVKKILTISENSAKFQKSL